MLTPSERKRGYFFRFDSDALRQANFAQRYAGYQSSIQSGWQTRNEVRAKEGLPALDGLDEPLRPLNMAPEGVLMEKEAEPEPDPTPVPMMPMMPEPEEDQDDEETTPPQEADDARE